MWGYLYFKKMIFYSKFVVKKYLMSFTSSTEDKNISMLRFISTIPPPPILRRCQALFFPRSHMISCLESKRHHIEEEAPPSLINLYYERYDLLEEKENEPVSLFELHRQRYA